MLESGNAMENKIKHGKGGLRVLREHRSFTIFKESEECLGGSAH